LNDGHKLAVPTSDGGFIVVDNGRLVKYDKDFNVIKEVDIGTDSSAGS
jgi:hypothetical protein